MTSSISGSGIGGPPEIPKASDAFNVWRFYCREIEADLSRFYHIDIRDWYAGEIDSGRLLRLLDGLPEESLFKTWALRGGDWTEAQYTQARLVNEVALSRADGKGYMPTLMKSPMQLEFDASVDAYRFERHDQTLQELRGEDGD